jgi:hypothetical protein
MDSAVKVRENRLRRMAERQGLVLSKCRRRDRLARDFGRWWLADAQTLEVVSGPESQTLDEVERFLLHLGALA